MSSHHEPKLLFNVHNIKAYHLQNGVENSLTPTPQTMSLLMVPTSSPFAGLSSADPQSEVPEEDFYLHLHLPPTLDLPLPATTQIYHQPPCSYLIPRWDLGPDSGAFTRVEFPKDCPEEDIDTFESVLAQATTFFSKISQPQSSSYASEKRAQSEKVDLPIYDPSTFQPSQSYAGGSSRANEHGQIVLVDEEDGSVVGELGEGFQVNDSGVKAGSKDPVEISLPQDGSLNIGVSTASTEYIELAMHPAYKNSTLVSKAAIASRFIVTTSSYVSNTLQSQADSFTQRTKPNAKPMTFAPITHTRIRKVNTLSEGAAGLSAKTVGQVSKYAQNVGASLARRGDSKKATRGLGPDGKPVENYKPGLLNKSMMAFSTIADGIDQAGRNLLTSSSAAAATVVGHKYGPEAGEISKHIGSGVKNVGLVYIDAAGVSRRAIVKSVAKGMVVGKVRGGGDLIVGGGDGGVVTGLPVNWKEKEAAQGRYTDGMSGGRDGPGPGGIGAGSNTPSGYYSAGYGSSQKSVKYA